jgi:hypothetical protein
VACGSGDGLETTATTEKAEIGQRRSYCCCNHDLQYFLARRLDLSRFDASTLRPAFLQAFYIAIQSAPDPEAKARAVSGREGIRERRWPAEPRSRCECPPSPFGLRRGSLHSLRERRLVGQKAFATQSAPQRRSSFLLQPRLRHCDRRSGPGRRNVQGHVG